jgi:hypothetical protein
MSWIIKTTDKDGRDLYVEEVFRSCAATICKKYKARVALQHQSRREIPRQSERAPHAKRRKRVMSLHPKTLQLLEIIREDAAQNMPMRTNYELACMIDVMNSNCVTERINNLVAAKYIRVTRYHKARRVHLIDGSGNIIASTAEVPERLRIPHWRNRSAKQNNDASQ